MSKRKLVMEERDGSVVVGVLQEGCDPIIKTKEGSIEEVLPAVPGFLTEAQEKWAVSPKNPVYKAPAATKTKPTPAAPAEEPKKAEDLPLLTGTEKPAEEQAEEPIGGPISKEAAIKIAEEQGGSREEIEAVAEETTAEAAAEGTEQLAAPAETEPETTGPPAGPEAVGSTESGVEEEKPEPGLSERIAQAPAPQSAETPSETEYYLEDGRGPFESVQLAMDAMGLDKDSRPQHNRWDRLSTALKEKIQRRPKS